MDLSRWSSRNFKSAPPNASFFPGERPEMSAAAPLVPGMLLGGVVIASVGAGGTLFLEKKNPTPKSLVRDFLIGAIMVAMIMQILPESSSSLITGLLSLVPSTTALLSTAQKGGDAKSSGSDEMEVKVGIPKF